MNVMSVCYIEQDTEQPLFRPFTRESLHAIQARIAAEKAKKQANEEVSCYNKWVNEFLMNWPEWSELQLDYHASHHESLEPDTMLEAGLSLPRALQRNFPNELIATPIEDIDKYYHNKMVCLLSFTWYYYVIITLSFSTNSSSIQLTLDSKSMKISLY